MRSASGQVHERRTDLPGGISGSSQSTVITCSSWSDCSRPAAAASKSVRPRGEPITAAQTRGGDRSAAMPTRVLGAARADHERRDLARDDRDAVDVARAGEDPAALGARRALVGDDGGREPARPRPASDAVVVAGDEDRAALVERASCRLLDGVVRERHGGADRVEVELAEPVVGPAGDDLLGQLALRVEQLVDPLLERRRADEAVDEDVLVLAEAVGAVGRLLLDGGVPPAVEVEDVVRGRAG